MANAPKTTPNETSEMPRSLAMSCCAAEIPTRSTIVMNASGRYWHRPNREAVVDLRALASAEGRSMTSLSLSWILHHSPADAIILGASNLEQLTENLNAVREGALA